MSKASKKMGQIPLENEFQGLGALKSVCSRLLHALARYLPMYPRWRIVLHRLDVFYEGKKIASHERLFDNNKWQLDPQYYLELIRSKPGAFDSALVIRQWRLAWPSCLERLLERFKEKQGRRQGLKILLLC